MKKLITIAFIVLSGACYGQTKIDSIKVIFDKDGNKSTLVWVRQPYIGTPIPIDTLKKLFRDHPVLQNYFKDEKSLIIKD